MLSFFDTKIEFLKTIGPSKAALLQKELKIFTFGDLLQYFPFRHQDRSQFHTVNSLTNSLENAQIIGRIRHWEKIGEGTKQRLKASFSDGTGIMELLWFQSIAYWERNLQQGKEYVVFGKPTEFQGTFSILHPETDLVNPNTPPAPRMVPVYSLTESLKRKYVDSKQIATWQRILLEQAYHQIAENLPQNLLAKYKLITRKDALVHLHLPANAQALYQARRRLKFEELFYNQLRLLKTKAFRKVEYPGQVFANAALVKSFYENHLPFELTGAQKKVIREIFEDMKSGKQMNRLLQGDVGSGKTITAFICMLLAIANTGQCCLMAPTEILADQHFKGLSVFAEQMGLKIAKLTGSTKKKDRLILHESLQNGQINIIVGTHALLEDVVVFNNLGLVVIDEQHRFGVAQRAKLWKKNEVIPPHILVMTATPIPRTLGMTLYGDLEISVINELPKGRKPIETMHRYDSNRITVFNFMRTQIQQGRQIYVVYPLIEENEKLDLKDLQDGYESMARAFPEYHLSIVHGKMKPKDKSYEMERFIKKETQIMVATTVIEVGVDVPNASVMVIENAERFGLSQLHQLRGRVGRGAEQSYCILMTSFKLSPESKVRLETMVRTTDGFEIADVDLQLRGPGDMAGTQQSGLIDLNIANLAQDGEILKEARKCVEFILETDPELNDPQNANIKNQLANVKENQNNWSRIS